MNATDTTDFAPITSIGTALPLLALDDEPIRPGDPLTVEYSGAVWTGTAARLPSGAMILLAIKSRGVRFILLEVGMRARRGIATPESETA